MDMEKFWNEQGTFVRSCLCNGAGIGRMTARLDSKWRCLPASHQLLLTRSMERALQKMREGVDE